MLYASRFLVDCIHVQVIGRHCFQLSWPFLAWPHGAMGADNWIPFFEASTYHSLLQDRMLSLAGLLMEMNDDAFVSKKLHKADLVDLGCTVHWWKACPSDRFNSILMAPPSDRSGHAYLGGMPMCPQCFEIVIIALDTQLAALLAVLPNMLRTNIPMFLPREKLEPAQLELPQIECDLWEDNLEERETLVSKLHIKWNFGSAQRLVTSCNSFYGRNRSFKVLQCSRRLFIYTQLVVNILDFMDSIGSRRSSLLRSDFEVMWCMMVV